MLREHHYVFHTRRFFSFQTAAFLDAEKVHFFLFFTPNRAESGTAAEKNNCVVFERVPAGDDSLL